MRELGDNLWLPHQVVREFWRVRPFTLLGLKKSVNPLGDYRQAIFGLLNTLTPTRDWDEDIESLRDGVEERLADIEKMISEAAGEPLDWRQAMADPSQDPVVAALGRFQRGAWGNAMADEESQVKIGLERFEQKKPPGYKDGPAKKEQLPERGTGEYNLGTDSKTSRVRGVFGAVGSRNWR